MKAYILYIEQGDSKKYALETLQSCRDNGIDAELFEGVKGLQNADITRIYGYTMGRPGAPDGDAQYWREFCCSLGHMMIWQRIVETNEPAMILEHDAIVKAEVKDLNLLDDAIYWLGPRVLNRSDYEYPKAVPLRFADVEKFEGTHAYIITPRTARKMLGGIYVTNHILMNVDGLMGVNNVFKLRMLAADPPLVVAEVGSRDTYAQAPEKGNAHTNWEYLPGFLKGLQPGVVPFVSTKEELMKVQSKNEIYNFMYKT